MLCTGKIQTVGSLRFWMALPHPDCPFHCFKSHKYSKYSFIKRSQSLRDRISTFRRREEPSRRQELVSVPRRQSDGMRTRTAASGRRRRRRDSLGINLPMAIGRISVLERHILARRILSRHAVSGREVQKAQDISFGGAQFTAAERPHWSRVLLLGGAGPEGLEIVDRLDFFVNGGQFESVDIRGVCRTGARRARRGVGQCRRGCAAGRRLVARAGRDVAGRARDVAAVGRGGILESKLGVTVGSRRWLAAFL